MSRLPSRLGGIFARREPAGPAALASIPEAESLAKQAGASLPTGKAEGLGSSIADVNAALPAGTAELTVKRALLGGPGGDVVFELTGFCCCGEDLAPVKSERHGHPPRIALGSLITGRPGGESPAVSLHRMRGWSRSKQELLDWLTRIRMRHGDDLRLIIWDDSGFDIPWELLWLAHDRHGDLPGGWLGELVTVSRWTTIHSAIGPMSYSSGRCEGEVVGYVADEMSADKGLLAGTSPRLADTFRELLAELERPGGRLALIYVACHGEFAETGFDFTLGDVSVGEIDWRTFTRIEESGGLVFINACHSGRLITDPTYNDATVRGFAEVFLRSGAYGFIGTAGAVLETEARATASRLIQLFLQHPGRPVAAVLREYRRSMAMTVQDLPPVADSVSAKSLLPFVNAYMYLFFGGLETTLALHGRSG